MVYQPMLELLDLQRQGFDFVAKQGDESLQLFRVIGQRFEVIQHPRLYTGLRRVRESLKR